MSTSDRPTASFDGGHSHTASFHGSSAGLPVELALELDGHCDAFEAGWRAGPRPSVENATAAITDPLRAAVLRELVALDAFYRRQAGERPTADEYLARFPDLDPVWLAGAVAGDDPRTVSAVDAPATAEVPLGTRVGYFGDYELLAEIARGGMGVVYRARQESLERVVALKMVRAGEFPTPAAGRRFRREVEAVAALDHPNLLPIHEVGEHAGRAYYTMPLLEGGSLAARVKDYAISPGATRADARSRQAATARLLAMVARAVHHAHQRGILHRDLKPSNVLLDAKGEPHVVDFGLARRIGSASSLTATGAVLGTPSYMAPEQARGGTDVTTQADVYGLGAVLYELLTGRPPFKGVDALDTLAQVRDREVIRPGAISPLIDRDLETICLKCLSKEAAKRYDSAAALADDLDRWARGEPILARRAGTVERAAKWVRRHPTAAGLSVVSVVAVLAAAGGIVALAYSRTLEGKNRDLAAAKDDADGQRAEAEKQRGHADTQRAQAEGQGALAQRYLYASRLALAGRAARDGHPQTAIELLDRCRPDNGADDLRGFEWHYLWARAGGDDYAVHSAAGPVAGLAFAPDGSATAAAEADGRVVVRDARTGRAVRAFTGPGRAVLSVVFSGDGRLLAAAGGDAAGGFVRVWEYPGGATVLADDSPRTAVRSVALSPDGERLSTARADGTVTVRPVAGGPPVLDARGHTKAATGVAFSPDGTALASCGEDGAIHLWRPAEKAVPVWTKQHSSAPAHAVAFSPDGGAVASACGTLLRESGVYGARPGVLAVWDAATGAIREQADAHLGVIYAVAFSRDGRRLVTGGEDRLVKVWRAETLKVERVLYGFTSPVLAVAVGPDGARVAAAGGSGRAPNPGGELRAWDLLPPRPTLEVKSQTYYNTAAFSPDGRLVGGCGGEGVVRLWDAASGAEVRALTGLKANVYDLAFSRDGQRVVAAGQSGQVAVWETATGRLLHTLGGKEYLIRSAVSPDGRTVVTGAIGETVRLFDAETGQQTGTLNLPGPASGRRGRSAVTLTFSPDGRQLAVAQAGGQESSVVSVWDTASWRRLALLDGPSNVVNTLAFSPDGRRLAAAVGGDMANLHGELLVWDTASWQELAVLRGHALGVLGVAYSPDGTRLVTTSADNTIKVWDAATHQELLTLIGHTGHVYSATFSPDGRRIVSSSKDGTVRVWEAAR